MRGLFLDTATQFARHWHCDSKREELKLQLEGRTLYCSLYVKCQYKATFLNSAIYLHNLLIRFKDLKRALRETSDWKNANIAGGQLKPAIQRRMYQIGLWMLEVCGYEEQKQRLQDLIDDSWETTFHEGVEEPLIDETSCVLANGAPEMGESGAYKPVEVSCTLANPPECGIETFWHNHRIQLEVLANMDIGSIKAQNKDTKELESIKNHARQISGNDPPYGKRCTVYLSDAIICIECTHCPEECAIHSINKKHFDPLGEVLGVETEPM